MPGSVHAGQYSAVTHYLKAVGRAGPGQGEGQRRAAVVEQMKATPTDDPLFGKGAVRTDGRVIHDMYLFEVKSPAESKEPWDYYTLKRTVPAGRRVPPDRPGRLQDGAELTRHEPGGRGDGFTLD